MSAGAVPTTRETVPADAPDEVKDKAARAAGPREPCFDPTVGVALPSPTWQGEPRNRLVVIGDSLTHGFQSGAVFNTDLSYGAIIAYELGWLDAFRYPRYPGLGGLPINLELLMRDLESRVGADISLWELPLALFRARQFMDDLEDYWERGPGSVFPTVAAINHALAVYGWDLRDTLDWTAEQLEARIVTPKDDLVQQLVENNSERAALRVYPRGPDQRTLTLFQAAARLGEDRDDGTDDGIETLVVFLGANNALRTVTDLTVHWSGPGYDSLAQKGQYTIWRPEHFRAELGHVVEEVRRIRARHVIFCTVPHVTIAPIARGVGGKIAPGSRYYPYYARPWVTDADFNASRDLHITGEEARAVDYAIDVFNEDITDVVRTERSGGAPDGTARDWYLLDIAGMLDRLAARRYINDVNARPPWWTPYPLPAALQALRPPVDSRFLTGDGHGGRGQGGLFSMDGVHPTTVAYGVIAQEMIRIMEGAGVAFRHPNGEPRTGPVQVDFGRLILRDTLVRFPPQIVDSTLQTLGWADEHLGWVLRTLRSHF
jgi:hypothetical protein